MKKKIIYYSRHSSKPQEGEPSLFGLSRKGVDLALAKHHQLKARFPEHKFITLGSSEWARAMHTMLLVVNGKEVVDINTANCYDPLLHAGFEPFTAAFSEAKGDTYLQKALSIEEQQGKITFNWAFGAAKLIQQTFKKMDYGELAIGASHSPNVESLLWHLERGNDAFADIQAGAMEGLLFILNENGRLEVEIEFDNDIDVIVTDLSYFRNLIT